MKSLKLFTTLSSIVAIGGTSALAVLTTSCGGEKERDFGTWIYDLNDSPPESWPVNIANAVKGYDMVACFIYTSTNYDFFTVCDYVNDVLNNDNYDMPYMEASPFTSDFTFWTGQPGTYTLKVLVDHFTIINNKDFKCLGWLDVTITNNAN